MRKRYSNINIEVLYIIDKMEYYKCLIQKEKYIINGIYNSIYMIKDFNEDHKHEKEKSVVIFSLEHVKLLKRQYKN